MTNRKDIDNLSDDEVMRRAQRQVHNCPLTGQYVCSIDYDRLSSVLQAHLGTAATVVVEGVCLLSANLEVIWEMSAWKREQLRSGQPPSAGLTLIVERG